MRWKLSLFVVALVTLTGCQALGQALGVQPRADAPAYQGVGVLVLGHDNDVKLANKGDQSGAVGASGQASQSAEQTLEVPQEVVDSLITAAQGLIAAGNPAAAAGVLDALRGATGGKKQPPAPAAPAKTGAALPPPKNPLEAAAAAAAAGSTAPGDGR